MASLVGGVVAKHLLPVVGNVAQGAGGIVGGAVGRMFGKKGVKLVNHLGEGLLELVVKY